MSTIQEFNTTIAINYPSLTDRARFTGTVLATVLSRALPLPPTPVGTPDSFYNANCHDIVTTILGELGNKLIIDAHYAQRIALLYWRIRYYAAHPGNLTECDAQYGMIDTYVRTGNIWAPVDHEYVNSIKIPLLVCARKADELLRELYPQYFTPTV